MNPWSWLCHPWLEMQSGSGVAAVCPHPNLLIQIWPDFLLWRSPWMAQIMHMALVKVCEVLSCSQVKRSWPGLLIFSLGLNEMAKLSHTQPHIELKSSLIIHCLDMLCSRIEAAREVEKSAGKKQESNVPWTALSESHREPSPAPPEMPDTSISRIKIGLLSSQNDFPRL